MEFDFILNTESEAELVKEAMGKLLSQYHFVRMADLNALLGLPSSRIDENWGWSKLGDMKIQQVKEGFSIDLPPMEEV